MYRSESLREYYKYCVLAVLLGLSGSLAGAFAYQSRFTMVITSSFTRNSFHTDLSQVLFWAALIVSPLAGAWLSSPLTRKKRFMALMLAFSLIPWVINGAIFVAAHHQVFPTFNFFWPKLDDPAKSI